MLIREMPITGRLKGLTFVSLFTIHNNLFIIIIHQRKTDEFGNCNDLVRNIEIFV